MIDIIKNKFVRLFVVALFFFFVLFFYKNAGSVVEDDKTYVVNAFALIKQDLNVTSEYVGYVVPINSVEVMANVSGYIDEIWAKGGEKVALGDNLVLIDQKTYKAEVDTAKASYAMAKANFTNAKSYYNRIKNAGKNAVSASQIDEAKAQFLSAEADVKQTKAELEKAKVMLDYTVLQASIDGIIGDVNLTKGNFVLAGQTKLFDIIQQNPIRVKFAISNKDYLNSFDNNVPFENSLIKLKLANGSMYQLLGKFAYFDNKTEKQTASVNVFIDFENPKGELLANSYVDVLVEKKLSGVYLINQNSAKMENEGVFAWIVKDNKLRKEKLNIVGYYNGAYVVDNKFAKTDFLVADNVNNIDKNTKIKVKLIDKKTEEM